jgi:hypothetical protein
MLENAWDSLSLIEPSLTGSLPGHKPSRVTGNPENWRYHSSNVRGAVEYLGHQCEEPLFLRGCGESVVPGGESIPAILKGIVKIPPILANCNMDAGLHVALGGHTKSASGQHPVIWGDLGRRFARKS